MQKNTPPIKTDRIRKTKGEKKQRAKEIQKDEE